MSKKNSNLQYFYINTSKVNGKEEFIGRTNARLDNCQFDAILAIMKLIDNNTHCLRFNASVYDSETDKTIPNYDVIDSYMINDTFYGWSKVNSLAGDIYDVEVGKDLAKTKCLTKYHKQLNNRMITFLKEVRTLLASVEHYLEKHNIDYSEVDSVETIKEKSFSK